MPLSTSDPNNIPGIGDNLSAIVTVEISRLIPLPGHPWKVDKRDVERAMPFVKRHARRAMPVLIDDECHVLSNAAIVEAARALGLKTLKVISQSGLTSAEALLLGTAISKIQTLGSWDGEAMEAALRTFEQQIDDFSAALIGFAPGELDRLVGAGTFGAGAAHVPELAHSAVTQLGMMWKCGRHHVLCGDATNHDAIKALLAGEKVAVALCDPPFGCKVDGFVAKKGKHREFVQGSGELDDAALLEFFRNFCRTLANVLKPGALIYLFIDWRSMRLLQEAAEDVFGRLVNLCVWSKDRAGMGSFYRSQHELVLLFSTPGSRHRNNIELGRHGRDRSNVWSYPSAASLRAGREGDMLKNHPTPKPVEMIADAIIDSSLRGEIVFDSFLGSGTTLIAAERTGRVFRGMDMDPLYVDLAVRRWQEWTGQDAFDAASGLTFNEIASQVNHG